MTPDLLFDRSKPIYPFVMAFSAACHGSIDLVSRRVVDLVREGGSVQKLQEFDPAIRAERFKGASKTPQLVDLEFQCQTGLTLTVDWLDLEKEVFNEGHYLMPRLIESAIRALIISCYAAIEDSHYDGTDEVWRFFKYVRHAAAHDGRFEVRKNRDGSDPITPARPAKWSGKEIFMHTHGTSLLQPENGNPPFLFAGDVLRLLHDIEAKF